MSLAQCKSFFCFSLFTFAFQGAASETANDNLQFSGFATLGAVYSDSDHHGYRKSVGSADAVYAGEIDFKQHSLLGLQVDWNISSNFDAVYQGVLRELPDPSFDRYTTLAFLRYEVNANWSFRLGRTAPDIFLLTEYRDVDFSYIWATAPNEVYGIIPYRSIDGIDVTYSQRALGGVFQTKLFTGSSEAEVAASSTIEEIKIEDIIGISLSFDHFNWLVQVKHSQVSISNEPQSNALLASSISQVPDFLWSNSQDFSQSLLMKGQEVDYSSLSAQYFWKNWLASAEISRIQSASEVIPKITSGYAALSYQLNAHQLYCIYAFTNSNNYIFDESGVNEQALEELIHATTGLMNFYAANQETISLGWRWDITSSVASSLQWNYTRLKENGSTLWLNNSDHHDVAENINTVFLTMSMVF
ncbi:hypothetical protein [Colwellia psychrerythraea]|uniref:Porin domain-containing protein n=1 Tax=Colwellia psychrerythraea TaxID=28229 RepID=A0A099L665_COLPS|nr:hypothetical protein [Colwellia psychrerythraea]KGJ97597.1 hypothetical protein GAB14E_1186 [Colwellia psychrerythraea]